MSARERPDLERLIERLADLLAPHLEERLARRFGERAAPPATRPPGAGMVTVATFAAEHSIAPATVRAMIKDGRLEGIRIGKRAIRIRRDAQIGASESGRAEAGAETPAARAARILGGRS
jgi:hypothetical protein